jgi:hypothetical protein
MLLQNSVVVAQQKPQNFLTKYFPFNKVGETVPHYEEGGQTVYYHSTGDSTDR